MKQSRPALTAFVIPPELTLAMAYFLCMAIWNMWIIVTVKFPEAGSGPFRLLSDGQLGGLTAINALLLVALLRSAARSRLSPPSLRIGHFCGLALGLVSLAFVQVWAVQMHQDLNLLLASS